MENFFAIWDQDEIVESRNNTFLQKLASDGMGLELAPNLETFLNSKISGSKLNPNSDNKIPQAYEFALTVQEEDLPGEFKSILKFFRSSNCVLSS